MGTTDRSERRLVLPLLAFVLAGTVGLLVYAVQERQELDHAYAMAELEFRIPPAARARAGEAPRRGEFLPAPATQREARAMVEYCETARRTDAAALRDVALRAPDPLAAANAIRALGRLRAVVGDPELVALLRDPRPRVRHETVLALGESGDAAAVPLLEPILGDADEPTRLLALRALGRIGGERAAAVVRRFAETKGASREEKAFAAAALAAVPAGPAPRR